MALDERLRQEFERAARPADPSGIYEDLIRRRERRRVLRAVRLGALSVVVVAGSAAGILALSRVIGPGESDAPVPISSTPLLNGDLAYTNGERIVIQQADGSDRRPVAPPEPGLPWHIAWSPDGSRLAVAIFADRRSLWVMDADGSDPVRVANAENVGRPSWHPDGTRITYASHEDARTEVHIVRADGTEDRVVYADDAPGTYSVFSSTFSPDGSEILFDAGTDVGFDIFVMASDGSNVRPLTDTGTDYNPAWSPDGSQIVFTRQESASGESDIFLMDADGANVRRITDDGSGVNLDPQFSPDGAFITYTTVRNGLAQSVIAMRPDGSDPEILIEDEVLGFSWQPVREGARDPSPPTESPMPSPSDSVGDDLGLGFPVCNITSVTGHFADPNTPGIAFVATRTGDTGGCPDATGAFNVVAVDLEGDGLADTSYGPIGCESAACVAWAAPDVDGDGTDELLVQNVAFSIAGLKLFEVQMGDGGASLGPVTVPPPGSAAFGSQGFEGGTEPQFWLGGDAGQWDAIRCEPFEGSRALVSTTSSHPIDAPGDVEVTETWFVLEGYELRVVDVREYTAPADDDKQPYRQTGGCGADLEPYG